jgi:hypothetical protein
VGRSCTWVVWRLWGDQRVLQRSELSCLLASLSWSFPQTHPHSRHGRCLTGVDGWVWVVDAALPSRRFAEWRVKQQLWLLTRQRHQI